MILFYVVNQLFLNLFDASVYQQNRYQKDRYMEFLTSKKLGYDILTPLAHTSYRFLCAPLAESLELISTLVLTYLISKLNQNVKEQYPLRFTKRMIRLFALSFLLHLMIMIALNFFPKLIEILIHSLLFGFHSYAFLGLIQLSLPLETYFRKRIVLKAKTRLEQMDCLKIGITGSYGKTSVKNLIHEVLSHQYSCCSTPLSYNNEMGISRTILENLQKHHEVFLCEMGADHLHEIEDLAKMIQPSIGIVTTVGPQHLSTFKTIENILHEKMQLIESLPQDGIGLINVDNTFIREYPIDPLCRIVSVGIHHQADIMASDIRCNAKGSTFHVTAFGEEMDCSISLLGEHNILNCLFAIGIALILKMDPLMIQNALTLCKPIAHRLELKPFYDGVCIDNAYNSNPDSAEKALQLLAMIPNRHLLITPGFLDLGVHHDYYCHEFARQMIGICDIVILVGPCVSIHESLLAHGFDENALYQVDTMHNALQLASVLMEKDDVVLIENDIPQSLSRSAG